MPLSDQSLQDAAPDTPPGAVPDPAATRASRHRWVILALLFFITVVNIIDRQTLSVLAPLLRAAFNLSNAHYGRIVAALQFGMMTGELPMGWLMDRWGPRIGLGIAVFWWSSATGSQVLARSGVQLGLSRFWMGTGECGNYSGGIKTLTRLFAKKERTLAIGIFNSGSVIGSTIAPPLIVYLLERHGLRAAFIVPALLGFFWIPVWWLAHGREPKIVATNALPVVTTSAMLRTSSAWAVMLCRFFVGPVMQFYWYWIPSYLYSVRHLTMLQIGLWSWLPFLMGDTGGVAGGWAAGRLFALGISTRNVRRITMYAGSVLCLASLLVPTLRSGKSALLMIGVAIMADNFVSANMFAAIGDLFPDQQVGRATGLTGVAGGLSGLLFPLLTGILVDRFSYTPVFFLVGFLPLVGTWALFLFGSDYHSLRHSGGKPSGLATGS